MQYPLLQCLTWSTILGSVASALLLAAGESGLPLQGGRSERESPTGDLRISVPSEQRTLGHPAAEPAGSQVKHDSSTGSRSR